MQPESRASHDSDEEDDGAFFGFRMPSHLNSGQTRRPPSRQPSTEGFGRRAPPSREPSLDGVSALQKMWKNYDRICESLSSMSSWGSGNSSKTSKDSWEASVANDSFDNSIGEVSFVAPLPGEDPSKGFGLPIGTGSSLLVSTPKTRGVRRATSLATVSQSLLATETPSTPEASQLHRGVRRGVSFGAVASMLGTLGMPRRGKPTVAPEPEKGPNLLAMERNANRPNVLLTPTTGKTALSKRMNSPCKETTLPFHNKETYSPSPEKKPSVNRKFLTESVSPRKQVPSRQTSQRSLSLSPRRKATPLSDKTSLNVEGTGPVCRQQAPVCRAVPSRQTSQRSLSLSPRRKTTSLSDRMYLGVERNSSFCRQQVPVGRAVSCKAFSLSPRKENAASRVNIQSPMKRSNSCSNKRKLLQRQGSLQKQNSFSLQKKSLNAQKFFSEYDKITAPESASTSGISLSGW